MASVLPKELKGTQTLTATGEPGENGVRVILPVGKGWLSESVSAITPRKYFILSEILSFN